LFRFADKFDKILMFFGSLGAIAIGTALPLFALLWGNMTNSFG
jgi:ATP-binding cassette subfamily B (MDR/TAP) protein 1